MTILLAVVVAWFVALAFEAITCPEVDHENL